MLSVDQERIGKFIAENRKKVKLTQEELATRLGVTNKSVSNWENGRNMPDLSIMLELCEILEISVNELFIGERIDNFEGSKPETDRKLVITIRAFVKENKKRILKRIMIITLIIAVAFYPTLLTLHEFLHFDEGASWTSLKIQKNADSILNHMILKNYDKLGSYGKKLKELNKNGTEIINFTLDRHYPQSSNKGSNAVRYEVYFTCDKSIFFIDINAVDDENNQNGLLHNFGYTFGPNTNVGMTDCKNFEAVLELFQTE